MVVSKSELSLSAKELERAKQLAFAAVHGDKRFPKELYGGMFRRIKAKYSQSGNNLSVAVKESLRLCKNLSNRLVLAERQHRGVVKPLSSWRIKKITEKRVARRKR